MKSEKAIELLIETVEALSARTTALEVSLAVAIGRTKNRGPIISELQIEAESFLKSNTLDQKKIGEALAALAQKFER